MLKYFRTAWLVQKLNTRKYMHKNVVQGCLSENFFTRKLIAQNILDTKYLRFTVNYDHNY